MTGARFQKNDRGEFKEFPEVAEGTVVYGSMASIGRLGERAHLSGQDHHRGPVGRTRPERLATGVTTTGRFGAVELLQFRGAVAQHRLVDDRVWR